MTQSTIEQAKVVSREEWLAARKELLEKEKQLTRQSDALAAERRNLPWVKVEKEYVFDTQKGKKKLADLFEGRSQLIVYHFMFGPEWEEWVAKLGRTRDELKSIPMPPEQRKRLLHQYASLDPKPQ